MKISDIRNMLQSFPDVELKAVVIEVNDDSVDTVNWITSILMSAKYNNQMTDLDYALTPGKLTLRFSETSFVPPLPPEEGQGDEEAVQLE